jgi:HK97 family phage portal protein
MSILTRLVDLVMFRDLPANRATPPPTEYRQAFGALPPSWMVNKATWPKQNVNAWVNDGYAKLALFFRCALAVSNALATAPMRVYAEDGGQKVAQPNHPLRRLMNAPNFLMSEAEFVAFVGVIVNTVGFCVVEKDRSDSGRVVALWPLRPDWLKEIPREYAPSDWEYRIPGRDPTTILARNVIVIPYAPDPLMQSPGIGPAQVLLREVGIANVMTDFVKLFFDQGAQPRYALIPADNEVEYTQAEVDAIKAGWMQRYGGLLRSVEPAFLQNIKDVKPIGFDLNEMAYPDLSKLTEARICSGFGVPPILVGSIVGLEHATYSNYGQARRAFYEDTITPLWARLDGAFTRGLLREFEDRPGYDLGFDVSDVPAFQEDVSPVWTRAGAAVAQGWATVNDARREANLPPVVGGDVFIRTLTMLEVPAVEEGQRRSNGHAIDVQVREVQPKAIGAGALYRLPPERRATIASSTKETIARIGERFAPELVTFFREQGARVIAEATRSAWVFMNVHGEGRPMSAEEVGRQRLIADFDGCPTLGFGGIGQEHRDIASINWPAEEDALLEVLNRLYVVAGETSLAAVSDLTGVALSFDLANPFVRDVLRLLAQRIVGITETTRQDVQRVVGQALDDGVSLDDLSGRLKGLFEETYRGRSMAISRTESMVAYNEATVLGYQQSGVVAMCELADNSSHTEDYGASDGLSCADRDGLIIELTQARRHIAAEHTNGSLAVLPVLNTPLGEE